MAPSVAFTARWRRRLLTTLSVVLAGILIPSAYAALAIVGRVSMTPPIFVGWLMWLQFVHGVAATRLWPHRAEFPTRVKAGLVAWGGIAFWYWLPAPIYYLLTMSLDEVQLTWTALAFFWEVPVIGGAFLVVAGVLFQSRRVVAHDPARQYRDLVRYPTLVALLLFGFTLAGYIIGALQTHLFAAMPFIESMKTVAHGVVISLPLAVFYHLALDRVVENVRGRIARAHGLGTIVARTVAGRITTVSMAVALSGFALITLFVLQAFQTMVADNVADVVRHDLARMAAGPARDLAVTRVWGRRARAFVVPDALALPAAEYSAATRRVTSAREPVVVHDSRRELKIVGLVAAPGRGGTLVGVAYLPDAYGPLRHAAQLLGFAGGCVLIVTVGMLVFASRASTQAVRALSGAVRRVEAGQEDAAALRIETADEIGELSGVVERYVRQSRDLRENLEQKVREKTAELLSKLEEIDLQQRRLNAVVDHIPEGVMLLERGGRVVLANPVAREHLAALTTLTLSGDVAAIGGAQLDALLELPEHTAHEVTVAGTPPRIFQIAARRLDGPGASAGCVVVVRDVTREREDQKAAQRQARLAAVGQLAAGIAHDFNNLLTVIGGRSEVLLRRLPPADPVRGGIDTIHKTAERAAALTRQLLAFSRKQVLQPKIIDLNTLVGQSASMLKRLIGEDIELTFEPAADLGAVRVDPGQMEQIVVNLSVNARDAMEHGGRLLIKTANAELETADAARHAGVTPGRYVALTVADNGVGMDAATQARMFEPFFTTKEPGKGTGLGLATVYGIVKQSGGHIRVSSEPGAGATFDIYLPRVDAPPDKISTGMDTPMPRGTETVLVAEDDDEVRSLVRDVLESLGYQVLQAAHPAEALVIAERHRGDIALLLIDTIMPQMNGQALAERIVASRPATRVLLMSGHTDNPIVRHGVLEAGTPFLNKPFSPTTLAVKIREVLDPSS